MQSSRHSIETNQKGRTMPSLPKTSAAGTAFFLSSSPLLFLLLLGSSSAQGASLREHRLRGSEPDPQSGAPYQSPNADMLKALEYIENLRQRSGTDAQQQALLTPEFDANSMDTAEKLRTMLSLASPAQSQDQAGQDENEEEREEKGEDGEEEEEDKTQEWLQAVLSTLQQTEKDSKPSPDHPNAALGKGQRQTAMDDASPWAQQQHGARSHRNHPLMFEEDEEGEGKEEEQEQGRASDHDSQFKRTNENVEEKYTPQNMATLQSVFEELGRLANAKAGHKRQTETDEDEDDGDGDDDNDMFNVRNLAYEDVAGGEEWAPLEEEEEEEEERNRQEFNRGLDYGNDEEGEDEEEDEDTYLVKRSSPSGPGDDPDDITKLVDYYLLKVLEKTEEEEHKRELEEEEEEEERAERRVAQSQYRDTIDPHAIYQLLQISQKLQIPPEDLLGLLKTEEMAKQDRTLLRSQVQPRRSNEISRVKDKLSQIPLYKKTRPAKLYNRRLPDTQSIIPDDLNTEEVLNILGLGSVGNHNSAPLKKQKLHTSSQSRFYTAPARQGAYTHSQTRIPDKLKDYDDTVDEDELAAYLAAQMLAQYPETLYNNRASQKRASEPAAREEDEQLGSFEQAIQDYFDRMDSDKSPAQKRQSETGSVGGAPQTQSLDEKALMKILSYLNPESEESEDKDADAKTVKGM